MRKLLAFLICSALFSPLFADVKVSYLSGPVTVFQGGKWIEAKKGMGLAANDRVKTVLDSKAVLTVDDTSRVWISPNSEMEVSSFDQGNAFNLLLGKIRAKVKLLSGRKFKVQTPVSVASVRGTDFENSSSGELVVFSGTVEFGDFKQSFSFPVTEGQIVQVVQDIGQAAARDMTADEKSQYDREWEAFESLEGQGGSGGEGQQGQNQQQQNPLAKPVDQLRQELQEIVADVRGDLSTARELTNEIKESDLSAGRTLRDMHGNLVRVEQHLLRPGANTMQLLNLTKRQSYVYSDRQHWVQSWGDTSIPSTSRLDVTDVTIKMNMPLPDQITEWPSYIADRGDDLHPELVTILMTNQQDSMLNIGEWRPKGQKDEEGKTLDDDRLVFNSYVNGYRVDSSYRPENDPAAVFKEGIDSFEEGEEPTELYGWGITPQMCIYKDTNNNGVLDVGEEKKFIRLYNEGAVINNDGGIMSLNSFTSTKEDPFTVLKQVAAEQVIFAREVGPTGETGSFFARGNLDLVYTPDLALAVAQKLATQVGEITGSSSGDDDNNDNNNDFGNPN